MVYRDLKSSNIVVDKEGHVKLIDFGMCKKRGVSSSLCGTPEYMSPEIVQNIPHDHAVDLWGLGCVIYELFNGHPPFQDPNMDRLFSLIIEEEPHYPVEDFPDSAKDLIEKLLKKDPKERLGYNSFAEIKTHPFFQEIEWEGMYRKAYQPPFKPTIKNDIASQNFDPSCLAKQVTRNSLESPTAQVGKLEGFEYLNVRLFSQ
eukprot:TRINITY_DN3933_c0_g3_i2.p1 TRINITY_DN3933_c0_g3~~TRINITY_DN3933_c0_g3_i2.p1  ORF type:complete len:202 (+),score=43.86 TRINITY_DN3933_c0_g3_i2:188-793(+)